MARALDKILQMTLQYANLEVSPERLNAERAAAKVAGASMPTEAQKVEEVADPVIMKVWPEAVRGVPNVALRSALFAGIMAGEDRPYVPGREIHSQGDIRISYSGALLDQADLDAWEMVLHLSREQNLSGCVSNSYQMLKALGLTDTGINRKRLSQRLSRLKTTGLKITVQGAGRAYSYEGSLIDSVEAVWQTDVGDIAAAGSDSESAQALAREYRITLNPKLLVLFGQDQYTLVDWQIRRELSRQPLAQWVHGYYSSHAAPLPVSVELLYRMSGSGAATVGKFAQTLRRALEAVEAACEKHGQPFAFEVAKGIVTVLRTPTRSQKRHLARAAKAGAKKPSTKTAPVRVSRSTS